MCQSSVSTEYILGLRPGFGVEIRIKTRLRRLAVMVSLQIMNVGLNIVLTSAVVCECVCACVQQGHRGGPSQRKL